MRLLIWILLTALIPTLSNAQEEDWRRDWEVSPDFAISRDSEGFSFPVQLAFVPQPGEGPDDPLYYVVELRGSVKVVTNSREVREFARVPAATPVEELPSGLGEVGAAGICLDPENGHVFVTFAYTDEAGEFRNDIARFSTNKKTFGLEPAGLTRFTEIFLNDFSAISHQIGPCQVDEGFLYVSVGNGGRNSQSRSLTSTGGKILRMTLDGNPAPGNPFLQSTERTHAKNFIWAYGLRNPFGLHVRDGRVLVADNGPGVDRFLEVSKGEDCLYDGTDWSMGARANMSFSPAVSPVAFDRYTPEMDFFPPIWTDFIFMALSGAPGAAPGMGSYGRKSVVAFKYDLEGGRILRLPEAFLRYRGNGTQLPVGLAFGPDGLYVVALMPDRTGGSPILRVHYDPEHPHPYDTNDLKKYRGKARTLMKDRGCFSCHDMHVDSNLVGPPLAPEALWRSVVARLESPEYRAVVADLDRRTGEFWTSYADERRAVLQATGKEQFKLWMKVHLQEPRFDNPATQMPNPGLAPEEIDMIVDFLVVEASWWDRHVKRRIGEARHRYWMMALAIGGATGVLIGACLTRIYLRRRTG